ncbi:MAG: LLM class flavin-dependent oxidoreductase [Rhodospirillales bacterium]|jgi:alkanesulfonate monooxygenase SsuD/methylene tetrahydromethanopterin reductase-like flavin-dependent oxidoreductase (luciferase family)
MDLSFFIQPVHPIDRDYGMVLQEDMDAIILADKLGYKEALIGEHFTDLAEPITSCLMFIARLIPETKKIKLGSGVVNLPAYHPVMVAGHVAMMDNLLEGRFLWGIGPGGQPSDIEAFGNWEIDRNLKMVEAFDQIMELWWGEPPFDIKGDFYSIQTTTTHMPEIGQGLVPKPWHKPHPPVLVTALAPYSHGITLAAERGWSPISCQYVQAHWVKTHLPKYLEGLKNAGQPEDPSGWRVAKCIFVAEDQASAEAYARSEDGPYGFYFANLMKKLGGGGRLGLFGTHPDQPEDQITLQQSLDTQVIAGTVESVVDQLLAFRDEIGPFGTLVYTGLDWADKKLAQRSMVLMAEDVMPRVNAALGE